MRGTNIWNQRPISAQFLAALARLPLPKHVKSKRQPLGVVDLVITAGKGRKFGPNTTYLTEPTRLSDKKFSRVVPVTEELEPLVDQDGNFISQGTIPGLLGDTAHLTTYQSLEVADAIFDIPSEQPHTPTSPRTSKPMHMTTAQKLREILEATPMKTLLLNYENAKGHQKGKRTLRQRLGDMSKMSPMKRQEVLGSMKEELDEDTFSTIMTACDIDVAELAMAESKKVRFSFGEDTSDLAHADDFALDAPALATADDPFGDMLPQTNPFWFEDQIFEPYPLLHSTTTLDENSDVLHVGPAALSAQLTPPTNKRTPASALSNSPTSVAVKYHHSHHNYDPPMQLTDPLLDDQPEPGSPTLRTTPPAKPQQSAGSTRTRKKWYPEEQTSDQALEHFEIPDTCVGSAVSYADGLKQRQVSKARGGVFEEQQFVVGMRFIVL